MDSSTQDAYHALKSNKRLTEAEMPLAHEVLESLGGGIPAVVDGQIA